MILTYLVPWFISIDQQLIGTNTALTEHNNAKVDVLDLMYFLICAKQYATYTNAFILRTFSPALVQLSEGNELWSEHLDEEMK